MLNSRSSGFITFLVVLSLLPCGFLQLSVCICWNGMHFLVCLIFPQLWYLVVTLFSQLMCIILHVEGNLKGSGQSEAVSDNFLRQDSFCIPLTNWSLSTASWCVPNTQLVAQCFNSATYSATSWLAFWLQLLKWNLSPISRGFGSKCPLRIVTVFKCLVLGFNGLHKVSQKSASDSNSATVLASKNCSTCSIYTLKHNSRFTTLGWLTLMI